MLKASRIWLGLLLVAIFGVLGLVGSVGPLTGFLGGPVVWAAPSAQEPPPVVSFTQTKLNVLEGGTASLGISLSSAATASLEVSYTVDWPDGRDGETQGTVMVVAGDSTATVEVSVKDDNDVGLKSQDVLTVALDQPGSDSGYILGDDHTAQVTVQEGICDRSERVQDLILKAVTTATECHEVTDSDLSSAPNPTGALYWGRGKLIPKDDSTEVRESKRPWLKAGDFRGMSGVTELYLGYNELKTLPSGVFDGLSGLKKLYVSHNLIDELEPGVFAGLVGLSELGLGHNPAEEFQLTPKLKPTEGNSFVVEIPEGAPFNVRVTLSAEGGTLSSESVTIRAGATVSPQVTTSPSQVGSSVGVKITNAVFTSGEQYGIALSKGDALNIPRPMVSVVNPDGDVEVAEGSTAQVKLKVDPAPRFPITVNYDLGNDDDPDTVDADSFDYSSAGSVTLESDTLNPIVPVEITNDADIDDGAREVLVLRLQEGNARDFILGTPDSATIIIKEGVCDRTELVQLVILDALAKGGNECAEVTDSDLASYSGQLDLSRGGGVTSLKSRDFMGFSSLTEIILVTATVTDLPTGVFGGLDSLTTLSLNYTSLASLDPDVFDGLTNLENLFLEENHLTALPAEVFSGLTSLEVLYLDNNDLAALPAGLFSGLTRLEVLRLDNNQLGALPAGLFSGLTSLHTLRLDDNELSALPVAMFSGLTRLHTLHLDNNDLATLPARLFSGLENLGTLSVAENQLSALPDGLFLGLGSLSEIDFSLNSTDPLELTAELVRRDPADGEGGFAVAVTTSHGWPGKMKGVLSATNATLLDIETVKTEVMLTSGDGDSAPARFEWVDESTDAKICIGTQNGDVGSIESLAATFDGLEVMASPSCLIVPPPQPAIPTVKITSPQVSAREGQQAKITFVVSPKATESFDLRFTTRVDGNDDTVDAIEGKDYTTPGPVKVSKDSLGGTIFIPIVNDTEIDEGIHEYFVVELSAPSEGDPYRLDPTRFTATVIINDGICDRAEAVQDAIIGKLDGSPSCYDVTGDELASITGKLDIARTSTPVTLRAGEFRGLSNVQTLSLLHVNLSPGLPVGLFEGLDSLLSLAMCDNKISSLNAGVFSGLKNLTSLDLDNNSIPSLPADLFADTPDLKHLRMYSNEIASLEGNVLRGATKLTHLELFKNKLSELPVGLFVGLSNLSIVSLHSNKVDPLEIPVIITDKGNGNFAVKVAQGAPFDISASFDITGGSAEASSATILAGSTESLPIKLEWGSGNVTITPVKPTWANGPISANNLRGLILTKGLPLEISRQEDQ